jgi:hypothetical protein
LPSSRSGSAATATPLGWFTEGFEMRDLKDAKALLEELASFDMRDLKDAKALLEELAS